MNKTEIRNEINRLLDLLEQTQELTPGDRVHGGIYVATIEEDGKKFHLICSDERGQSTDWLQWSPVCLSLESTKNENNGQQATDALAKMGSQAALFCVNLNIDGYTDWYLPSKNELDLLFENKDKIGSFVTVNYWSSTEFNSVKAWRQGFGNGGRDVYSQTNGFYVRAVRRVPV